MTKRATFVVSLLFLFYVVFGMYIIIWHGKPFSVRTYPHVDGSTSTWPMGVLIACETTGTLWTWTYYTLEDDQYYILPVTSRQNFLQSHENPGKAVHDWNAGVKEKGLVVEELYKKTKHHGTHESYVNLIEGKVDLVLPARKPSEDEMRFADKKGIEIVTVPIAKDAFVFMHNKALPIENLTLDQIRSIYSGKIVNWSELGGPDKEIHPYVRDRNSGSQVKMERLVMKDLLFVKASRFYNNTQMVGPFNSLWSDEQGIAYSVYYYCRYMNPVENVALFSIGGISPTHESIRAETYPLTTYVYAAYRSDLDMRSREMKLLRWILSEDGQATVERSGYVSID